MDRKRLRRSGTGPFGRSRDRRSRHFTPRMEPSAAQRLEKNERENRNLLRTVIEQEAVAWAVEMVMPEEIDRINILNASFAAMSRAVTKLGTKPQLLLIDGNRFRSSLDIPYRCIVKGDATYAPIAAASVLAKTYRDEYMMRIAAEYPVYKWEQNKGYPTREHRKLSCATVFHRTIASLLTIRLNSSNSFH